MVNLLGEELAFTREISFGHLPAPHPSVGVPAIATRLEPVLDVEGCANGSDKKLTLITAFDQLLQVRGDQPECRRAIEKGAMSEGINKPMISR